MSIGFELVSLSAGRPSIEEMLPAQWADTGDAALDCEPNWVAYEAIERAGGLVLLVAYEQEIRHPIGYLAMFLHPHPNAKSVRVGTIATYYVEQRTARAMILRAMVQYAVRLGRERGVHEVRGEIEAAHQDAGRFWQALGFTPYKVSYRMILGQETAREVQHA